MSEFFLEKLLADEWGVKLHSEEYWAKWDELRSRRSKITMVPAGPPCDTCGDNSYDCGCVQ